MALIECSRCGCMLDVRTMLSCGICGARLCEACSRESHGVCDDCAGSDRE